MKITQDSYGKIVMKKISEEMSTLMSNKRYNHSRKKVIFVFNLISQIFLVLHVSRDVYTES